MADQFDTSNVLGVPSMDDAVDNFFIAAPPPPEQEVDANVDAFLDQVPKTNLKISRDTKPDKYVEDRNLGEAVGMSAEAVAGAPEVAEEAAANKAIDAFFGGEPNPATSRFLENLDNARASSDAVEDLGLIERLSRGFQRGKTISQLGIAGLDLRNAPQSIELKNKVAQFQQRLQALGEDTEGFISALAGVSEFFGQRVAALSRPRAAALTAAGGTLGAAAGLAGGPLAPVTVPAGAVAGEISGFLTHNIMDVGEVEAGLSYVEQLEEGVDPAVAYWTSLGVGVVNAGLETLGGASFLRPLSEAGKTAFRQGLRGVVKNPEFVEAARKFAVNYGLNVGVETATEVAQEVVNIAAEELGKELTEGLSAQWAPEEWEERLTAIAIKTLKTTALLGAPGSTFTAVRDVRRIRQANADAAVLREVKAGLDASPLTERSPVQAAEHIAESFNEAGVTEVFIPVEALSVAAAQSGDPTKFYDNLGVTQQIDDAEAYRGDVRISVEKFSQHILQTDQFAQLEDHVRMDPEGFTVAEGEEQQASAEFDIAEGIAQAAVEEEVVSRDTVAADRVRAEAAKEGEVFDEVQQSAELAEQELGVQALFKSAAEAGFTEKQYASYLAAIQRQQDETRKGKERRVLNRRKKRLGKRRLKREEALRQTITESVTQEPLYQAQLAIGRDRLDFNAVSEIFGGDEATMQQLPRINGRRIYGPKTEKGLNPDILADNQGFEGGDIMLFDFLDSPSLEEAIAQRTEAAIEEQFPTLVSAQEQVEEALQALHAESNYGDILAFELNKMREARGQKKLKPALIKARAKEILSKYKLSDINIRQLEALQRREAARARKAIREGDLGAATQAKLNQTVAFQMTKEAYQVREEVAKGNKYLRKFLNPRRMMASLPINFRETILDVLSRYQLGPRQKQKDLQAWSDRKLEKEGIITAIPDEINEANGSINYQDLSLSEWRNLRDTVKSIEKQGVDENKFRRAEEARNVQSVVDEVIGEVQTNLSVHAPKKSRTVSATKDISAMTTAIDNIISAKDRFGVDVSTILLNVDSILRNIDGFKSLGVAYTYIKGGIDRAITEGYLPGQVGYVQRMKDVSTEMVKLFDMYSKTERNLMWREQDIPGVRRRLTKLQQIGVLLNMGNAENINALIESGEFTQEELQAIVDNASKKDLDFAQATWDFLGTFQQEISDTVRRRQNRSPVMVEALSLDTLHGTYAGGYFPLQYDNTLGVLEGDVAVEEATSRMLFGGYAASHTANGHTETRKGSGGRPVKLDPFILNNHVHQVVYDLEVGDAVADSYKVLHHKDMKNAFADAGQVKVWDALDLWLGDVITGELHRGGFIEGAFRHIRTGTTISSLAFNFSVAALQPLGLLQSAVQVGKKNLVLGMYDLLRNNPLKMYGWVTDQSGFMRERELSFNKDVIDAFKGLKTGKLSKITPGNTAEVVAELAFWPIAKMQRFVDVVTWLAAKRQAVQDLNMDDKQSTLHADRMVVRTQGSGNFQERTSFERGTVNKAVRNTEVVRAWSLFLNYFAAKLNVAYERTKKQDINPFKHPIQFLDWATDIFMLYAVEGVLASVIKEGWPDDEDEDDTFANRIVWEATKTFSAGLPVVRDTTADAEGFNTGGATSSFFGKVSQAGKQISQAESDAALFKAINNVTGVLLKYPTSQVHKTGQALYEASEGEDITLIDFIMGPQFRK